MRLKEHHFKPVPKFRGNGEEPYYLGLELEVEAPDGEKRSEGLSKHKRPRHFYAKRDGSLNSYGWELITMPIGKSMWLDRSPKERTPVRQLMDFLRDLRDMRYCSHTGERCGLHIHVCRKAFGPTLISSNHYYWFSRLVNGPLFRKLCQRTDDGMRWCKQISGWNKSDHVEQQYGRYWATNITDRTVEVRIFRGNMREDRVRKAVESVIAAIEFTRMILDREPTEKSIDLEYRGWVFQHDSTYPNLASYLDVIDVPFRETQETDAVETVN